VLDRAVADVELDKALAACTEAIRINKDDPAPFDSRGLVNLRLGKWVEAFEDYRVAARFSTCPFSRYGAGLAVLAYGLDMPRGESLVASALERDPKAGDQLNELGFTQRR
jgi:tetratricopeptide (TPR) repeat protein